MRLAAPKDFRQRRPDGKGGWKWSTKGTRMVPYRLPELLRAIAAGEIIYIAEGEKGVDALRGAGLAATCSPGGAGKWRAEFAPFFRGADVIVLPDNDDTGRQHADQVARNIVTVARSMRILDLAQHHDDFPAKGDPYDWFALGRTAEDLGWIAEAADLFEPGDAAAEPLHNLATLLDIHSWAALDIPPEPKLLGGLITPTSRMFLVGRTGLGKTLLLHAMAAGMASGQGFLHWRSERASRWLIVDGEMPSALLKAHAEDTIRRTEIPRGNLVVYSLDRAEQFAELIPGLGILEPINTPAGQQFVLRLAEAVGAEGIGFDNVMSLVGGDQRDEIPWTETLPLVAELSKRRIAQVYLDHTGHNNDRQYGSAAKAWRMDAVGIMTPLPDTHRDREVAFSLSFEPPGKARRRTPDNWDDFATSIIRLAEDQWTSEASKPAGKLTPTCRLWHLALLDAMSRQSNPTPGRTTRALWFAEAARTGLVEPIADGDTRAQRDRKLTRLRKYATELRIAGHIGIDGETVINLQGAEI